MRIAYIELAGFRGFKSKTRFDFPNGFCVITGRNGVGKSTAFDALDFALTGSISKYDVREAKGGGLDDHLWWIGDGTATEHYVSVGFADEQGSVREITRGRDGLILSGNFDELAASLCTTVSEMPTWADTLVRTSLIRDETIAALSLDLTEQARFTAVRAALGASEASEFHNRLKSIVKLAESGKEEQSARHARTHEELGRALTALTEARSVAERDTNVAAAEALIDKRLLEAWDGQGDRSDAIRSLLAERRRKVAEIKNLVVQAEKLSEEQRSLETEEFQQRLTSLRSRRSELQAALQAARELAKLADDALATAQAQDSSTAAQLALLEQGESVGLQNGQCPLCASPQTAADFLSAIQTAKAILNDRTPLAAQAQIKAAAAAQSVKGIESSLLEIDKSIQEAEASREQVQRGIARLTDQFMALAMGPELDLSRASETSLAMQEELARLEQAVSVLESSGAHDRVASLALRVEQLRGVVEEEAVKLNEAERAVDRAQQIEKASKIVANEMLGEQLDTVLPLLKELYQRLRPHADWREIEIDVAGQVRASLNFTVGDGKNPQFLFSSGQRRAAGLAFLLAIHLARPWCGLNTLMMDDPVQHVDDYRALNLVEVLSSIRRSGRQVIVAVEDSALADVLCRRLRSSPNEGGRRFDLGLDLDGSASIVGKMDVPSLAKTVFEIAEAS